MNKKYWEKELSKCQRHQRKISNQVERKLAYLDQVGKMEEFIQKKLAAATEPNVKAEN